MEVRDLINKWKVEILIAIIALTIVGGYLITSSGGGGKTVSSVDITVRGVDNQSQDIIRIKAREINRKNPDLWISLGDREDKLILNNDGPMYYVYKSELDRWLKASGSTISQNFSYLPDFVKSMESWASGKEEGKTYTIDSQGKKLDVTINRINPTFSDELFEPPENMNVGNMVQQ